MPLLGDEQNTTYHRSSVTTSHCVLEHCRILLVSASTFRLFACSRHHHLRDWHHTGYTMVILPAWWFAQQRAATVLSFIGFILASVPLYWLLESAHRAYRASAYERNYSQPFLRLECRLRPLHPLVQLSMSHQLHQHEYLER